MQKFYTLNEIAETFKMSYGWLHKLVKANKLKAHKVGRSIRVSKTDLEEYLGFSIEVKQ
jgi:excisionase family DNA binding protein